MESKTVSKELLDKFGIVGSKFYLNTRGDILYRVADMCDKHVKLKTDALWTNLSSLSRFDLATKSVQKEMGLPYFGIQSTPRVKLVVLLMTLDWLLDDCKSQIIQCRSTIKREQKKLINVIKENKDFMAFMAAERL